jgi:glc operon protein GlcG
VGGYEPDLLNTKVSVVLAKLHAGGIPMDQERITGRDITMEEARKVIEAMLQAAINIPEDPDNPTANAPMSLAVVDTAGVPVYVIRMNGASTLTLRMAINKAFTAIETRRDTIDSDNTLKRIGRDITSFNAGEPRLTYVPGGVLLRAKDGSIVGAVGTSGRRPPTEMDDEGIARIGAKAYLDSL